MMRLEKAGVVPNTGVMMIGGSVRGKTGVMRSNVGLHIFQYFQF